MRLGDRIAEATGSTPPTPSSDPLTRLKDRAQAVLFARLGEEDDLDEAHLRRLAVAELEDVLVAEAIPLSAEERERLVDEIAADILGFGPLQPMLDDPSISEIMVNGLGAIWIEREGRLERTGATFASDDHLRRVIERIVAGVGRRIDESSPMVDARLPDGSRVNAVLPPLAVDGPTLAIRKFRDDFLGADDFLRMGSLSEHALEFLACAVEGRLNVLVSGGTGSGKTTLLNLLSSFIPRTERIVTIEDAVELRLRQEHVVRYETRPANVEGRGEVSIRDLVRNSLRVRPDRIIVGECRGGEALDMLQAMNTGHDGSLSTLHANTPRRRLVATRDDGAHERRRSPHPRHPRPDRSRHRHHRPGVSPRATAAAVWSRSSRSVRSNVTRSPARASTSSTGPPASTTTAGWPASCTRWASSRGVAPAWWPPASIRRR